jgi:hypothetical protein
MGNYVIEQEPQETQSFSAPVHRSIVAVDLEGSTQRTNPVKGEIRNVLYNFLEQALLAAGITVRHREQHTDRGDGVLVLIRPHDDVPKTVLLGQLMPVLATLLAEHNSAARRPELQIRLRAVVHAGEIHQDGQGFYGDDLDIAFRLLDSPRVKWELRRTVTAPLIVVVSEEIFTAVVRHGYVSGAPYRQLVRVRVGDRQHRGWVHVPLPANLDYPPASLRAAAPV